MTPRIKALDHLVLTVADIAVTVDFYTHALGMQAESFTPAGAPRAWRCVLGAENQLAPDRGGIPPHAGHVKAGSADLCFLSDTPLADWQAHLSTNAVTIEEGPVQRTGAQGSLISIYLRDPDGNLIELSNKLSA